MTVDEENNEIDINWKDLQGYVADENLYPVSAPSTNPATTSNGTVVFDNLGIGAWLIVASGTDTEYTVMGTYTYGYDSNNLMVPIDVTVNAKGEDYKVTKKFADGSSDFVGIGDKVTFDIETVFPSYGVDTTDRTFSITDTPEGLSTTNVTVKVGNQTLNSPTDYTINVGGADTSAITFPTDDPFTINFTEDYINSIANTHAGAPVTVIVEAIVIGVDGETTFSNTADTNKAETPSDITGDTGSITLNKKDKDEKLLTGAEFTVTKEGENTPLQFVLETTGVYRLALETDANQVTNLVATNGSLVVKGLEAGTYKIKEVKAPEGYSTVEIPDKTIVAGADTSSVEGEGTTNHVEHIVFDVIDTKLASLPETGGIGTTIFTIGGCAIMIVAAGLYFASRRKQENK